MSNKKLHSSKIQDLDSPQIITNLTLSNELSLRDAALAIYMNDWGFQAEICLEHDRQEHNFSKPPWEEFAFDIIYMRLLTACCDGSLRIASTERILSDTIPENLITVSFDELLLWLLENKYKGERLVPSSLAKLCSFRELFQFHNYKDPELLPDDEHILKPKPGLALYIGELEGAEPVSEAEYKKRIADLTRQLKLSKKEKEKLESFIQWNLPSESKLLTLIVRLVNLLISGGTRGKGLFHTEEDVINEIETFYSGYTNKVSKRYMQDIFAKSKSRQT